MLYNNDFFEGKNREEQVEYLEALPVLERILISRYAYGQGLEPLFYDSTYDDLLRTEEFSHLSTIPYERDPIEKIEKHLQILGLPIKEKNKSKEQDGKERLMNLFSENKSMLCVTSVQDFKEQYLNTYLNDSTEYFVLSYKHDGWNITTYYLPGMEEPAYAHTRGRDSAEVRDCTELMRKLMPKMKVEIPTKIVCELVVKKDMLDYLREKYPDKKWVNARNSVSSFVSGSVREEDYKALDYFAFVYDDLSNSNYGTREQYKLLKDNGFKIPLHKVLEPNLKSMVEALTLFEDRYVNGMKDIYECDGLVMVAKTKDVHKEIFTAYSTGMVAIKAGYWSSEILKATIKEIYYSHNKKVFTPMARIHPVLSRSGSRITNVPLVNLNLVSRDWICPGDEILIEYHSQQNVYYLSKEKGGERPKRD